MTQAHTGAGRGAYKEGTMSKAKTLKAILAGVATLLLLSAERVNDNGTAGVVN